MEEDILARGDDPADFPILNSKPDLFPDLHWIWEAFMVLSSSRQIGMAGPLPITMTEIHSYCEYESISDMEDRVFLREMMQEMDRVLLKHYRENKPNPHSQLPHRRGLGG